MMTFFFELTITLRNQSRLLTDLFLILYAHVVILGFRVRTRSLISESWVESHSCPHITEAMICDDPICFLWRVTSQGPCVPYNGSCGLGIQEQTVECISVIGEQLIFAPLQPPTRP